MTTQASLRILGVRVSAINMKGACRILLAWARSGPSRVVFVRDVHGLMTATKDPVFLNLHEMADLVLPDGAPLTWVGRLRGAGRRMGRTAGTDVVECVCRTARKSNLRHFFFGGKPGVAHRMVNALSRRIPGFEVAGILSPPMRDVDSASPLTVEEMREIEIIRQSRPDFIWVGISTPKQEHWMMKAAPHFDHGVFLGVGAAFDFHSGAIARAPKWMQRAGLEWLHRLLSEPKRLWRRYLVFAPQFAIRAAVEQLFGTYR